MGYRARNGSESGDGNGNRKAKKKEPEWGWGLGNLCIKITEVIIIGIKGGIIAITIMTTIMTMTDYEYVGLFLNLEGVNERVTA